jgi:hypothetical protein
MIEDMPPKAAAISTNPAVTVKSALLKADIPLLANPMLAAAVASSPMMVLRNETNFKDYEGLNVIFTRTASVVCLCEITGC